MAIKRPLIAEAAMTIAGIFHKTKEVAIRNKRAERDAKNIPFLDKKATMTNTAIGKKAISPYNIYMDYNNTGIITTDIV